MNWLAHILAEADIGFLEIIVVAVIFILGIIGSAMQKHKEKQKQREARDRRSGPAPSNRPPPQIRRPQPAAPPQQAPPPRPAQAESEEVVRVSEELRRSERRQKELEEARRRRLAMRPSPEADTAAIEANLLKVPKADDGSVVDASGRLAGGLGLLTPADARRAIILHEILSPPKALRQGDDSWDV